MALIKQTEYEVVEAHFDRRALQPTIPVRWLRDNLMPGDKLGVFIDVDKQDQLIIRKVGPSSASSDSVGDSNPTRPSVGQG